MAVAPKHVYEKWVGRSPMPRFLLCLQIPIPNAQWAGKINIPDLSRSSCFLEEFESGIWTSVVSFVMHEHELLPTFLRLLAW